MHHSKTSLSSYTRFAVVVICLAGCLFYFSCSSKKEVTTATTGVPDLTGTWELRQAQNGMMPTAQYEKGNGTFFRFTQSTFEQYENDTLARSGGYSIERDSTVSASVGLALPSDQFRYRLLFDNDSTEKTFIDLRGDTLEMVAGFFPVDAGSRSVFVKTAMAQ